MMVNGKSRVFGIFGDPVAHSLSPLLHNAAFASCGLDAVYVPFHVLPEDLPAAVAGVRALQIAGLSVTVPHKERIVTLLDEIDPLAAKIGAVNTVVNRDGRLYGYNTDASGLLRALQSEFGFVPAGKRILLLGAGGAGRAALVALITSGAAAVCVVNRTYSRAREMVDRCAAFSTDTVLTAHPLDLPNLAELFAGVDLVVNTSALGLKEDAVSLPFSAFPRGAAFYDMVYSPLAPATALVVMARNAGIRAADGRSMLAAQGEDAFFLWTGQRPPDGLMPSVLTVKSSDI